MRKKVNYAKLNQNAVKNLRKINELAKEFSKYESTAGVKKEISEILRLSNVSKYKNNDRNAYDKITENIAVIESALDEVYLLTSDAIKKLNKLPDEVKEEIYYQTGIDKIEESDQGISEDRTELLDRMMELVEEITEEYGRYFNLDKEEFVEFEDEVK